MANNSDLHQIVLQAREDFMMRRIPQPLLTKLYLKYTSKVKISSFLSMAEKSFPNQACGLASVYLQHKIGSGKVKTG